MLQRSWEEYFRKYGREAIERAALNYPAETAVVVPFPLLARHDPNLADFTLEWPSESLAAAEVTLKTIPVPLDETPPLGVRLVQLSEIARVPARLIRAEHMGRLLAVQGLVRRVSEVRPRIVSAAFECLRCREITMEPQKDGPCLQEPPEGSKCEKRTAWRFHLSQSDKVSAQRVELQEMPEGLRGGQQPERLVCHMLGDLCGKTAPGDRVTLNGVLDGEMRRSQGRLLTTIDHYLRVNSIEVQEHEFEEVLIAPDEEQLIRDLAKEPNIYSLLERSLAPSLFGLEEEKRALLLQLFGGVPKELKDGTQVRGDVHALLVGDPGVAKSQLLRYMARLAPRSVYTSGKASTAAGLTAAAVRDEGGDGRWTLEAGALVLADKGLCAVDEIDKMDQSDQGAMHEAMEQQTVSIAKAGIVARLHSRCAVLGAANPKLGRFVPEQPLAEQIEMSAALMSRFDVILVLADVPHPGRDEELAEHILGMHTAGAIRAHRNVHGDALYSVAEEVEASAPFVPPIEPDLLRKYVAYARRTCMPKITLEARVMLRTYYRDLRRAASNENDGPLPLTARQLEALVRLAEAAARARLSNAVEVRDAQMAIDVTEAWLRKLTGGARMMDIDLVTSGVGHSQRERVRVVLAIVRDLETRHSDGGLIRDVLAEARGRGLTEQEASAALDLLRTTRVVWSPGALDRVRTLPGGGA